jgi:hypothetical protein
LESSKCNDKQERNTKIDTREFGWYLLLGLCDVEPENLLVIIILFILLSSIFDVKSGLSDSKNKDFPLALLMRL